MEYPLALPQGTILVGDYRIIGVLGAGGFGITYLAQEIALGRNVAIKEFFPNDIAVRDGAAHVGAKSQSCEKDYHWGLERFIEEAQTLARFNHNNIVRVYRYFRENNTAYMVLHFEQGLNFKKWLGQLHRPPKQDELNSIVRPLLSALDLIHRNDFLHRDIAPDNIIIRKNGSPVLVDFGSARGDIAHCSKTVSALIKPGYSPYELYAVTSKDQGPWTDIYSLGATLYQAITGIRPTDAPTRIIEDDVAPSNLLSLDHYNFQFLKAIDKSLELKIEDRPQSIADWSKLLFESKSGQDEPAVAPLSPERQNSPAVLEARHGERSLLSNQTGVATGTMTKTVVVDRKKNGRPTPIKPIGRQVKEVSPEHKPKTRKVRPQKPKLPKVEAKKQVDDKNQNRQASPPEKPWRDLPKHKVQTSKAVAKKPPAASANPDAKIAKRRSLMALLDNAVVATETATPPKPKKSSNRKPARTDKKNSFTRISVALAVPIICAAGIVYGHNYGLPYLKKELINFAENQSAGPELIRTFRGHNGSVRSVAITDDGKQIISGSSDSTVKVWDTATGNLVYTLEQHKGDVKAIDIFGKRVVSVDENGMLVLWNVAEGRKIKSIESKDEKVSSVAFTGDPNKFVTAGNDWHVNLWDSSNGTEEPSKSFKGHSKTIQTIAYSSKGNYLAASGADKTVKLWKASTHRLIRTYRGHKGNIRTVAISGNGRRIATGSDDKTIKIWSTYSNRLRRTLKGHTDEITALAFSPDNRLLVSGSKDETIKIWDWRRGKLLRTLTGHSSSVSSVTFTPNGKFVVSGSADKTIRLWAVKNGKPNKG